MRANLRAGIAVFNAGGYHAAHDAWEDRWLDLPDGDDERFLHGLIQYTAAVHHGYAGNWAGLHGLAGSAVGYLAALPGTYRSVNVGEVRGYLSALQDDPEHMERIRPPALRYDGEALALSDLDFEATAIAAGVLAEEADRYDAAVMEDAVAYAAAAVEGSGDGPFVGLVFDFVREADRRDLVYNRLVGHVERRRGRDEDVAGLFE